MNCPMDNPKCPYGKLDVGEKCPACGKIKKDEETSYMIEKGRARGAARRVMSAADRSAAAKKGWETRKRNGWKPKEKSAGQTTRRQAARMISSTPRRSGGRATSPNSQRVQRPEGRGSNRQERVRSIVGEVLERNRKQDLRVMASMRRSNDKMKSAKADTGTRSNRRRNIQRAVGQARKGARSKGAGKDYSSVRQVAAIDGMVMRARKTLKGHPNEIWAAEHRTMREIGNDDKFPEFVGGVEGGPMITDYDLLHENGSKIIHDDDGVFTVVFRNGDRSEEPGLGDAMRSAAKGSLD
jgi:hypothetical protein